jgi:DNA-binding transcriptional ArsR family regulator
MNNALEIGSLPHEVDKIILRGVPPEHVVYGRALAKKLGLPYAQVYYHVRKCLEGHLLITLPDGRNKTLHVQRSQKETGGLKVARPLHKIDLEISKILENLEASHTTLGEIAKRTRASSIKVRFHLTHCLVDYLVQKPKNGRIEDSKVTKACEIVKLALEKINAETGGFKK